MGRENPKISRFALALGIFMAGFGATVPMRSNSRLRLTGVTYQSTSMSPHTEQGCLSVIDRVKQERVWDPRCIGAGGGIRPGPGD